MQIVKRSVINHSTITDRLVAIALRAKKYLTMKNDRQDYLSFWCHICQLSIRKFDYKSWLDPLKKLLAANSPEGCPVFSSNATNVLAIKNLIKVNCNDYDNPIWISKNIDFPFLNFKSAHFDNTTLEHYLLHQLAEGRADSNFPTAKWSAFIQYCKRLTRMLSLQQEDKKQHLEIHYSRSLDRYDVINGMGTGKFMGTKLVTDV